MMSDRRMSLPRFVGADQDELDRTIAETRAVRLDVERMLRQMRAALPWQLRAWLSVRVLFRKAVR